MNDLAQMQNDILRLQRQLAKVKVTVDKLPPATIGKPNTSSALGPVLNYLRNGDLSLSQNHYDVAAPPSGTNTEREAAYFYTHAAGTTLLVEDSAHALS